jgi:allantoicase
LHETELSADHRHFFPVSPPLPGVASHLRLNIFPDGGVSRLRVWGALREED